jgi:hypothetical protein
MIATEIAKGKKKVFVCKMYSESCCSKEIKNSLFVGFFFGPLLFLGFFFGVICRGRFLFILLENFFRNPRQGMKQASNIPN